MVACSFTNIVILGSNPGEVIHLPFVVRKNEGELSKNFGIDCRSREMSGPYNFLTLIKSSIPDV